MITSMHNTRNRAQAVCPHAQAVVGACLACCLAATAAVPDAAAQDVARPASGQMSLDVGIYDLQRAHNDRSILIFGSGVEFKRYYLVKMLDQYFTLVTKMPGGEEYDLKDNGTTKTIVIH